MNETLLLPPPQRSRLHLNCELHELFSASFQSEQFSCNFFLFSLIQSDAAFGFKLLRETFLLWFGENPQMRRLTANELWSCSSNKEPRSPEKWAKSEINLAWFFLLALCCLTPSASSKKCTRSFHGNWNKAASEWEAQKRAERWEIYIFCVPNRSQGAFSLMRVEKLLVSVARRTKAQNFHCYCHVNDVFEIAKITIMCRGSHNFLTHCRALDDVIFGFFALFQLMQMLARLFSPPKPFSRFSRLDSED